MTVPTLNLQSAAHTAAFVLRRTTDTIEVRYDSETLGKGELLATLTDTGTYTPVAGASRSVPDALIRQAQYVLALVRACDSESAALGVPQPDDWFAGMLDSPGLAGHEQILEHLTGTPLTAERVLAERAVLAYLVRFGNKSYLLWLLERCGIEPTAAVMVKHLLYRLRAVDPQLTQEDHQIAELKSQLAQARLDATCTSTTVCVDDEQVRCELALGHDGDHTWTFLESYVNATERTDLTGVAALGDNTSGCRWALWGDDRSVAGCDLADGHAGEHAILW